MQICYKRVTLTYSRSSLICYMLWCYTSIRFNEAGTKLAATTHGGRLSVWSFQYRPIAVDNPIVCASDNFEVHDKHANDFEFVKVIPLTTLP
jgi:hypothetical protein